MASRRSEVSILNIGQHQTVETSECLHALTVWVIVTAVLAASPACKWPKREGEHE